MASNGEGYFRLIDCKTPNCKDFHSHRHLYPNKRFHTTECIARSLSVFTDISDCLNLTKLPMHRNKTVVEVALTSNDGVLKQTGNKQNHYSWWRSCEFDFKLVTVREAR